MQMKPSEEGSEETASKITEEKLSKSKQKSSVIKKYATNILQK